MNLCSLNPCPDRLTTTPASNPDRRPKTILPETVRGVKLHVALVLHVNFRIRIGPNATGTSQSDGLRVGKASPPKERICSRSHSQRSMPIVEGKDGVLQVLSQKPRSRAANRKRLVERFAELTSASLERVPIKKNTPVGKAAKLRCMEKKKKHGILKDDRSQIHIE